ncbi:hypothetical protein KIN20_024738 [Parelaphostrongylus tenuis]|uniref:Uncharacterized protein n=1 Tax=Parelaphostrongylus tenuis TaxID=148309 RepID=A0AAD5QWG8_PARTN|nr:hypothetical protein KIN20_024738 [Parelaphostrongylus tenuis]
MRQYIRQLHRCDQKKDMMLNESLERGGSIGLVHGTGNSGSAASARLSHSTSTGGHMIQEAFNERFWRRTVTSDEKWLYLFNNG